MAIILSSGGTTSTGGTGSTESGIPAAIIRSGTTRNALGDVRAEGLLIGLEHIDAGPDWGLSATARRTNPIQAHIQFSDGTTTLTITIPVAVASGTAGNDWEFRHTDGSTIGAVVDTANERITLTSTSTHTWAQVVAAINAQWAGAATTQGTTTTATGSLQHADFENGRDPETISAEVDEDNKLITITYASSDTVQAVRDALNDLEINEDTTLKASEIHDTSLLATMENPNFSNRPFTGFYAQGQAPSGDGTGTEQRLYGQFASDGTQLELGVTPGNELHIAVPEVLREAGGGSREIDVKTGTYQIVDGDEAKLILFTGTSGATFALPAIPGDVAIGWTVAIASLGTANLTIGAASGDSIRGGDGQAFSSDLTYGQAITLQAAENNNWLIVTDNRETDISGKSNTNHTHSIAQYSVSDFGTSVAITNTHLGQIIRKTGAAAGTMDLPDIGGGGIGAVTTGFHFWAVNVSSTALTIDGNGSDTIDGSTTFEVPGGTAVRLVATNNTSWSVIANTDKGAGTTFDADALLDLAKPSRTTADRNSVIATQSGDHDAVTLTKIGTEHLAESVEDLIEAQASILSLWDGLNDPLGTDVGFSSNVTTKYRSAQHDWPIILTTDRNNQLYQNNDAVEWDNAFTFKFRLTFTHDSAADNENGSVQVFWGSNEFTSASWLGDMTNGVGVWINRIRTVGSFNAEYDNYLYMTLRTQDTTTGTPSRDATYGFLSNAASHTTLYNGALRPASGRQLAAAGFGADNNIGFYIPETNDTIEIRVQGVGDYLYILVNETLYARIDLSDIVGINYGPRFGWSGDNNGHDGNVALIHNALVGSPDPVNAIPSSTTANAVHDHPASINDQTGDYTILATDEGDSVRLTGGNARTFTLPDITGDVAIGWYVTTINNSSAVLTLDGDSDDTIDGATTIEIPVGRSVTVQAVTATSWAVIANTETVAGGHGGFVRTEVGSTLNLTSSSQWAAYNMTELIDPSAMYQFANREASNSGSLGLSTLFFGQELITKGPETGSVSETTDDYISLVIGRQEAVGAQSLFVSRASVPGSTDTIQVLSLWTQDRDYDIVTMYKFLSHGGQGPKGDDGDLTSVTSDATLTGDGTSGNPLAVANPFTDADEAKLDGIENNATADQSATEIRDALAGLSGNDRLGADAIRNNLEELTYSIKPSYVRPHTLVGRYVLDLFYLPSSFEGGINRLDILIGGFAVHNIVSWTPGTGTIVFDITESESNSAIAGLGGMPTTSVTMNVRFKTGNAATRVLAIELPVIDDSHDSSSGGTSSRDHQRISALEEKTAELVLRDHESWEDATVVTQYAIHTVPAGTAISINNLPSYSWALTETIAANGSRIILLRTPAAVSPNPMRVRRTDSGDAEQEIYRGGWTYAGLEQSGYDYYTRPADAMMANDVLTVQRATVDAHTDFEGHSSPLQEHTEATNPHDQYATDEDLTDHERQVHAHQDSPQRVSTLHINAPAGREVYLTEAATHPVTENIFTVPLQVIGDFVGATVINFSSIGGPGEATNQASYPAIMDGTRVSGIWQQMRGLGHLTRRIYVAVLQSIGTPTHLHINGSGENIRFALTPDATNPTVTTSSGVVMIMHTELIRDQWLELLLENMDPVAFSLQYAAGFLDDDGTIDSGVDHAIGHYESEGNGQWKTRADAILDELTTLLSGATVAQKQRLLDALDYEEVLYEETSAVASRTVQNWNVFDLSRNVAEADDSKWMYVEIKNTAMTAIFRFKVEEWRTLTPQDMATTTRTAITPSLPFVAPRGENDERSEIHVTLFHIGRPSETMQTTGKLGLISQNFATNLDTNNWGASQIKISLRGF